MTFLRETLDIFVTLSRLDDQGTYYTCTNPPKISQSIWRGNLPSVKTVQLTDAYSETQHRFPEAPVFEEDKLFEKEKSERG